MLPQLLYNQISEHLPWNLYINLFCENWRSWFYTQSIGATHFVNFKDKHQENWICLTKQSFGSSQARNWLLPLCVCTGFSGGIQTYQSFIFPGIVVIYFDKWSTNMIYYRLWCVEYIQMHYVMTKMRAILVQGKLNQVYVWTV